MISVTIISGDSMRDSILYHVEELGKSDSSDPLNKAEIKSISSKNGQPWANDSWLNLLNVKGVCIEEHEWKKLKDLIDKIVVTGIPKANPIFDGNAISITVSNGGNCLKFSYNDLPSSQWQGLGGLYQFVQKLGKKYCC